MRVGNKKEEEHFANSKIIHIFVRRTKCNNQQDKHFPQSLSC